MSGKYLFFIFWLILSCSNFPAKICSLNGSNISSLLFQTFCLCDQTFALRYPTFTLRYPTLGHVGTLGLKSWVIETKSWVTETVWNRREERLGEFREQILAVKLPQPKIKHKIKKKYFPDTQSMRPQEPLI